MKGLFPEFDPNNLIDFKEIWADARFCFDANILLNLYRYRPNTRDELVEVLSKLKTQIWIPHHVALEFQRNRLKVISDQNQRFTEVRNAVEKARDSLKAELGKLQLERRHSLIDPEPIINGFEATSNEFLAKLGDAEKEQIKIADIDPLKSKIEELFSSRVGDPPADQKTIDDLYKEGEIRQSRKVPPGYMDADKDKDGPDDYLYRGIFYKRKYGDFVVWRQMIDDAKKDGIKRLIFVTDDSKEDWWWILRSDGPKTIGPRPELVEEAKRLGGLEYFHMYKPESFLSFASSYLKADVSTEAIEEVRDVSKDRQAESQRHSEHFRLAERAENAVYRWLVSRFDTVERNNSSFPDFVTTKKTGRFGFEVKILRRPSFLVNRLQDVVYRLYPLIAEGRLDIVTIVWVVENEEVFDVSQVARLRSRFADISDRVRMLIGRLSNVEGEDRFIPIHEFGLAGDSPVGKFGNTS